MRQTHLPHARNCAEVAINEPVISSLLDTLFFAVPVFGFLFLSLFRLDEMLVAPRHGYHPGGHSAGWTRTASPSSAIPTAGGRPTAPPDPKARRPASNKQGSGAGQSPVSPIKMRCLGFGLAPVSTAGPIPKNRRILYIELEIKGLPALSCWFPRGGNCLLPRKKAVDRWQDWV